MSRLERARSKGLVHLQLVHYRVSELGDISTEQPVHGGLTSFGREVVAACNRLGTLIDIAHGTSALIEQALELAAKPIVYSHGHVTASEPRWTQNALRARGQTRRHREHAGEELSAGHATIARRLNFCATRV